MFPVCSARMLPIQPRTRITVPVMAATIKQDHHGHRTVLVSVIQRCSNDTVACDGFSETACFLKMRRFSSRDAFAVSDFATHEPTSGMRVIALAKVDRPEPSFTDAVEFRPCSDTISV